MGKQPTIFFFGMLFCIGLLIQILTSSMWYNIPNKELGETTFIFGQSIGELCYIFGCRRLFRGLGAFVAITEFAISLILVDLYTIVFLNPYNVQPSAYFGFVIAVSVLIVRFKTYNSKK